MSAPPDIFLSYNREDQARAKAFAEAFAAQGFSVWWDVGLKTGEAYDQVTEKALNEAKAVVVLWSKKSVESRWVRAEATQADRNKTLVPVMIEACRRPIMFELTHTAELSHWKGDPKDRAWLAFLADLRAFLGKALAGPQPAAASPKPAASGAMAFLRRPIVLGCIALAVVALVAVGATTMMGSKPPAQAAANNKLTAFFGFAASGDDPAVRAMAEAATAETFKTFSALGLETASEASTGGVKLTDQLAAAKSLKARYVLGGEVRQTAGGYDIAIRIDDVDSGKTLWREAMSGGAAQTTSLPVAAAAQAGTTIDCLVRVVAETGQPTEAALAVLPRACASFQLGADRIPNWRQAVKALPNSAFAHAQLAAALYSFAALNPGAQRAPLEGEAREEAKRAVGLDPKSAIAQDIILRLSMGSMPLAEIDKRYVEALARSGDLDPQEIGQLEYGYGLLLMMVGRVEDAAPHLRRAAHANPLSYPVLIFFAHTLMQNGQKLEGRSVFEQTNARLPSVFGWVFWVTNEVADPDGDADRVLKLAPLMVSGDAVACYRNYASAAKLPNGAARRAAAMRVRTCATQTGSGFFRFFGPSAYLGDVDGAFERMQQVLGSSEGSPLAATIGDALSREGAAARADPRFLPLMKKTGQYQYWLDTGTQPDACKRPEEREFEVCRELRKDQGK